MSGVVIIGGGHNGLTAAFYLAKAGRTPIVLEARDVIGGGAVTGEICPGFMCPTLTHETPIWADVVRDMDLSNRRVRFASSDVQLFARDRDGRSIVLYRDAQRTSQALEAVSSRDARAYPRYRAAVERVATVLASLFTSPPPDVDAPSGRDIWNLFTTGRAFRALGKKGSYRLLRWGPMPVSDLMDEWFESDVLRASLAGPGVSGTMLGPRSAGSSLVLLMREAHAHLAQRPGQVLGGPGALTTAMATAAIDAGADIRTGTPVDRILIRDDRVAGVIAAGREVPASAVISAVDPKTTFLKLVDPVDLTPDFMTRIRNYRSSGTIAKVNLALLGLPAFGVPADQLAGRIHVGPDLDYLERAFDYAKYGEMSEDPWLDIAMPSVLDPELAPPGGHVMSIYVHYTPYQLRTGDWDSAKATLLDRVLRVLERVAPGIRALVVGAQTITPAELERDYGFFGGHPFHGELALDQLFTMRPLIGYGRYSTPIRGLYLCGAGTHPGGFLSGGSGKLAAREILSKV